MAVARAATAQAARSVWRRRRLQAAPRLALRAARRLSHLAPHLYCRHAYRYLPTCLPLPPPLPLPYLPPRPAHPTYAFSALATRVARVVFACMLIVTRRRTHGRHAQQPCRRALFVSLYTACLISRSAIPALTPPCRCYHLYHLPTCLCRRASCDAYLLPPACSTLASYRLTTPGIPMSLC